jgi:hypothetical protein
VVRAHRTLSLEGDGFVAGAPAPCFGTGTVALLWWAGFVEGDLQHLLAGGATCAPN